MIQLLGERLSQAASDVPDRTAVVVVGSDQDEALTWRELQAATQSCGDQLKVALRNFDPRTVVSIPAANTIEAVVRIVSALRSGLRVVLADPTAPESDHERMCAAVERSWGPVVDYDEVVDRAPRRILESDLPVDPDFGGYALMTGGSTGVPRPVVRRGVPRRDSLRSPSLLLRETNWRPGQRQLVVGPICHAAPFSHFLDGLLDANTVIVLHRYFPKLMFEVAGQHQVEWIQLAPAHLRMADELVADNLESLRHVRGILHTSAPCPETTKAKWIDTLGPHRVFEIYAATEGIGVTLCKGPEWLDRPGTVGRGFFTKIRILGDRGVPLPAGEEGLVCMRTVAAPGHPSETSGRQQAARGYRTVGDRGRLDSDGYLYLAGRNNEMAVVGGENVYFAEVERVLMTHASIADAAVLPEPHRILGATLVAFVEPRAGSDVSVDSVLAHCRRGLAPIKVPRRVVMVSALPRLASGKLQRRRLPLETES